MPEYFLRRLVTQDGRRLSPLAYVLLFLLCMAFFTPGLTSLPPIDRDEPLFAQASKQMIETHDYVDIRFQDKPRYKKPIGIYWLQAASVTLLNPDHLNEIWAYRVPSLLGATIAVMMTAALGALLFNPMTGFLAAVMMVGCVLLNVEARLAKTDAALLAAIMVMHYALAVAYRKPVKNLWMPFAFWTALGIGFLIKGPVIVLVLASILLWLRIRDKNLGWFSQLKPRFGIPYALMLVAPWFVAINLASNGAFLAQSAGHDMLAKIWQSQDHTAVLPPGLYLLAFPVTFFPFSLFALFALPDVWANRRKDEVSFCLAWIVPVWIIFEVVLTKLPHYVLPTYPAIAILAAKAVCDGFPHLAEKNRPLLVSLALSLWLMIGTALAIASILLPNIVDQTWSAPSIVAAIILIVIQFAGVMLLFLRKYVSAVGAIALGSLLFLALTFGETLPNMRNLWMSREIVRIAEQIKPCEQLHLISAPYNEPSLVFLAGTNTVIHLSGAHAAAELQKDPCAVAVLGDDRIAPFLNMPYTERFPQPAGMLHAYSIGNAFWRDMSFYVMPQGTPSKGHR